MIETIFAILIGAGFTVYFSSERSRIRAWFVDRYDDYLIRYGKKKSLVGYDPRKDKMYILCKWGKSEKRKLDKHNVVIKLRRHRPEIEWIPKEEWHEEAKKRKRKDGQVCYLIDFEVDHYEGERGNVFKMEVAKCLYYERNTTQALLTKHPNVKEEIPMQLIKIQLNIM